MVQSTWKNSCNTQKVSCGFRSPIPENNKWNFDEISQAWEEKKSAFLKLTFEKITIKIIGVMRQYKKKLSLVNWIGCCVGELYNVLPIWCGEFSKLYNFQNEIYYTI